MTIPRIEINPALALLLTLLLSATHAVEGQSTNSNCVSTPPACSSASPTPIFNAANGHWYLAVSNQLGGVPTQISWEDADRKSCLLGGHLAVIDDCAENGFVYDLVDPRCPGNQSLYWSGPTFAPHAYGPWLGGYQRAGSTGGADLWYTVLGGPITPQGTWLWVPGQPDNMGEHYLHFNDRTMGGWNNLNNFVIGDPVVSYVVEFDAMPSLTPAFSVCALSFRDGRAELLISNLPMGTTHGYTLVSTATQNPVGTGPLLGLDPSTGFVWDAIITPPAVGNPLSWIAFAPGAFPDTVFQLPVGTFLPISGARWDFIAIAISGSQTFIAQSAVMRATWL